MSVETIRLAGTEAEQLVGALERLRATFRWKADGLDDAGLQATLASSRLTLGGLLKHLAAQEDYLFTTKLSGDTIGAPWDATGLGRRDRLGRRERLRAHLRR